MLALLLTMIVASPPGEWRFVDELARDGRTIATFRTVELADAPTSPLHAADQPATGARFGSVGLGPGGRHRLGIVWNLENNALWFDADGDGRYSAAERHVLDDKPVEAKVAVPFGNGEKRDRTVMICKRGEGLAWTVRGFTIGSVAINGEKVSALLADGDADGCFDGAAIDRVWLDLDSDERFDALTEQFPLGTAITVGGTSVLVRPSTDGLGLEARTRPNETGSLRVELVCLPKASIVELHANYVSEFGELVVLKETDKPVKLPVGKYRLDSVRLKLADGDGKVWHYDFTTGDRTYHVEVSKAKGTVHRLLDGLKVTISLDAGTGVIPGGSVRVQPAVVAGGLELTRCEVGFRFAEYGREVTAQIKLTEPGSITLDRCNTGFH